MSDNTHAAMCVYCGETIIYDTRKVTDMAAAHAQIVEHDQQCPKNPLVARIAELERYNLGLANESCELQERVARLNKALTRQANAATLGIDAAKKVAGSNLEQAKRLHAVSSPAALESEREANARLTDLVIKLEQERDAYRAAESYQIALREKAIEGRDEAAANANRLRAALHYCNEYLYGSHLNTIGHGSKAHMEIVNALGETPVTSLARRDALKQAEALEEAAADTVPAMHKMKHWLLSRANDLRQQAEGHQ